MGLDVGQSIKSKKLDINLEIIVIDNLLQECTCVELYSHDAKQFKVKFEDVEV